VHRKHSSSNEPRERPRCGAFVMCILLTTLLGADAAAQRIKTPGPGVPPGGIGGGAGLIAPLPPLPPAMQAPTLPAPVVVTPTAPPVAAPPVAAPAAPARVVRFRCELAPQDQSCREPGAGDDGGGGGEECSCARDYCHTSAAGTRICEKLQ